MTAGSRNIFTVGDTHYAVRDILGATAFRGELEADWLGMLRRRACESRADEEERESDGDAVDAAVQEFRYDRDLITAEETEKWLAERDLTLSDFAEYFSRQYWATAMDGAVEPDAVDYLSAPPELRALFVTELTFSGQLDRMATRLAWRLAAVADNTAEPSLEEVDAQWQLFSERVKPTTIPDWCERAGRDDAWVKLMSLLEATFRLVCDGVLSPQARKREISSLRLELTMFDLEILEVDSADAAREAILCVREDGMSMEAVATDGRYPLRREQVLLEDVAPEMQQQLLSVIPGRVLEPTAVDGAHRVCRVMAKHEPDPESADVRHRLEQRLLNRHFAEAVRRHVRWELAVN